MDHGFWFDRKKLCPNVIQNLEFIAAMGEPGGGRTEISPRIISNFHVLNFTIPNEAITKRIYEVICEFKFQGFYDEIKQLYDVLPLATIQIFNEAKRTFLPTPQLCHYQFNMRDISKVFQGLFKADKNFYDSKEQIIKLWGHEILRVFQDRLAENLIYNHGTKLREILNDALEQHFQMNFNEHVATVKGKEGEETYLDPIFVDFLGYEDMRVYEEVHDMGELKVSLENSLEGFNNQPRATFMDMVLFE